MGLVRTTMGRTPWDGWIGDRLRERRRIKRLRELDQVDPIDAVHASHRGHRKVLFSTNDYLGLSSHPSVVSALIHAASDVGLGPRGSALVCGYGDLHAALEEELARLKAAESALLFPTGFAANCATLAALADHDLAIFSDELNHASIIDGCRLAGKAGAEVTVYRHSDLDHLERLLGRCTRHRKLIVTDSLFSMDGDLAALPELVEVKRRAGAWLMIDEAHATLVFGKRGGGWAEVCGVEDEVEIQVGTLSKAFGAMGGFVAGSRDLRTWLLNAGRPLVFSTALPVPIVAASLEAIAVRRREPERVVRLFESVERVAACIGVPPRSPILPWALGDEGTALEVSSNLYDAGLWVPAIRPPTVPSGTSRLRITLSAAHSDQEVDHLVTVLQRVQAGMRQ